MKVTIQYVDIPKGHRVFAASDLHGHGSWLKSLLDEVGFCDDDYLFLVGDCLERGSENLATLRYVMELCKRPNVYATLGNVDVFSLGWCRRTPEDIRACMDRFLPWYGSTLFTDMCEEAGLAYGTLEEIACAASHLPELFKAEFDFMYALPTIIETPFYRFVHGGIPTDDLGKLDLSEAGPYLKNDAFIEQGVCFDKWLIVGHWPASLYRRDSIDLTPYVSDDQHIIDIDGGCGVKSDGHVNLLLFPKAGEDTFTSRQHDDFPLYRALDTQLRSAVSGSITYADPGIDLLESRGELCRVRRQSDGYEMWVPAKYVKTEDGKSCIWGDCSDFRPEIRPGDVVSLIRRDAVGAYIKLNGVCGYYDGRLEPLEN